MNFAELYKTDVTKHIEKKGKFSYLSWPFAVAEFRKNCPEGTWRIEHFEGKPYCASDAGHFVEVTVYPEGNVQGFTQVHPILNGANKPIAAPNSFEVNTSIQRCLVKAIALATGIGLHIYAGEDLPDGDEAKEKAVAEKDAKCSAQFDQRTVDAWLGIINEKKELDPDWWPGNKPDIIADCGEPGAKVVHAAFLARLAK